MRIFCTLIVTQSKASDDGTFGFLMPGTFAFSEMPTRTDVIEELFHAGQHRSKDFKVLDVQKPVMEMAAQKKLSEIGKRINFTKKEMKTIQEALKFWEKVVDGTIDLRNFYGK